MRSVYFNEYVSTGYKVEVLAEFDLPTVRDRYGNTYPLAQGGVTYTPDGDPLVTVDTVLGTEHLFVEDIRKIEGESS